MFVPDPTRPTGTYLFFSADTSSCKCQGRHKQTGEFLAFCYLTKMYLHLTFLNHVLITGPMSTGNKCAFLFQVQF